MSKLNNGNVNKQILDELSTTIQRYNEVLAQQGYVICQKCGYYWKPRKNNPKRCPECKQDWRTPKKFVRGKMNNGV